MPKNYTICNIDFSTKMFKTLFKMLITCVFLCLFSRVFNIFDQLFENFPLVRFQLQLVIQALLFYSR